LTTCDLLHFINYQLNCIKFMEVNKPLINFWEEPFCQPIKSRFPGEDAGKPMFREPREAGLVWQRAVLWHSSCFTQLIEQEPIETNETDWCKDVSELELMNLMRVNSQCHVKWSLISLTFLCVMVCHWNHWNHCQCQRGQWQFQLDTSH
jgi:hypothetical protein